MVYEGKVEAVSKFEAAALIKKKYAYIVHLEKAGNDFLQTSIFRKKGNFTDKQRIIFFKQLAVILNSGVPLLQGIDLLQHRLDSRAGALCWQLKDELCKGSSLNTAMARHPDFFPPLAVILVEAGEMSGSLNQVLQEIADYYEKQYLLKHFLYKSAAYPVLLLLASLSVLVFFMIYVLPVLAKTYISMQARPGFLLEHILLLSSFLDSYGAALSVMIFLAVFFCIKNYNVIIDMLLKLPVLKSVYSLILEIRFCRILSLLLSSGINITHAVNEAGKVYKKSYGQAEIVIFSRSLERGADMGLAARNVRKIFSALTVEFIAVGTATGKLPHMLSEASKILEQDLKNKLNTFKEILAPVLLLTAALMTALVVCAVIAPLFDLFSAIPD